MRARRAVTLFAAIVALSVAAVTAQTSGATSTTDFCPPGDASTLIADQIVFLGSLDPSPSAGIGTAKSAETNATRFAELQSRLNDALAALETEGIAAAQAQIASVLRRADGDPSPPDWLTGDEAAALAEALGCIGSAIDDGPSPDVLYVLAAPDATVGPQSIVAAEIGAGGSLSPIGTFATSGEHRQLTSEHGVAVSPDRRLLFVTHGDSNEVEAFGRGADGSLVSASVASTALRPTAVVAHPVLPVIYVSENSHPTPDEGRVGVYSYTPDGVLSLLQTLTAGNNLRGIAVSPGGGFLVTAHIFFPQHIEVYSIAGNGTVSVAPVDTDAPAGAQRIDDVYFDPAGTRVYVRDLDQGIFEYSFAGGAVTLLANHPVGAFFGDAVVTPGAFIALTSTPLTGPSQLLAYPIGASGLGVPTSLNVSTGLENLAVTSDGGTLFASSRLQTHVRSFTVGPGLVITENAGSPFSLPVPAGTTTGNLAVSD